MTKKLLTFAAFLALCAGPAAAAGLNLGWNDCPAGAGYTLTRTFACTANTGVANSMFVTFVAPANVLAMSACEIVIDLQTGAAGTLDPWWSMRASAPLGCRAGAMTQSADFTGGPGNCFDYWAGGASAGVSMDPPIGNRARIKALPALPAGSPGITSIAEGTEVYAIKVNVSNAKTVGLGSCAGCSDEACIVLNSIKINQPVGPPANGVSILLTNPATSQHVIWQAWTTPDPNNACPLVTPNKRQTWGSIKAIYR